jgi:type III pantothenate kinase
VILCIDAGNSRLKWGLWDEDGAAWRARDGADYGDAIAAVSLPLQLSLPVLPQRILACNVAGAGVAARIEALAAALAVPLAWFRSSAAAAGVRNGYAVPTQLGADRWAALIGARARHAGSALVVMAGTATTIDVLDAAGVFRGGLILPGLDLMRRALAQNTAALPEARGCFHEIPVNTDDAIVSGSLVATLGAIEWRRMTRVCGT